jgi:hypothetical protein
MSTTQGIGDIYAQVTNPTAPADIVRSHPLGNLGRAWSVT